MVGALAWAQQDANDDDKSRIIALERVAKLQACESKDLKTLDAVLDKDLLYVDPDGKLETKADILAFVQAADSLRYLTDAMIVQRHNDTAIVTGLYQIKGVMRGAPFLATGRFVDTWLLKNGRWVIIASLLTSST